MCRLPVRDFKLKHESIYSADAEADQRFVLIGN